VTDTAQQDTGAAMDSGGTLVCEGSACAIVGAVTDAAVLVAAPGTATDWLDGLLRKQISDQVDEAGASTPHAG